MNKTLDRTVLVVSSTLLFVVMATIAYVKLNTHDPAPAFPQEIVEQRLKFTPPYAQVQPDKQ